MISKLPVPLALLKNSLGIRESSDIVKATVSNDVIYLFIASEDEESVAEYEDERLEVTYSVGANEAS